MNLSSIKITDTRFIASLILVVMCIQIVPIEGYDVSIVKVILMSLTPFVFIFKKPVINKAVIWGLFLILTCFFCATFAGPIRYSTIGYFVLFVLCFITYYTLIREEYLELSWFIKIVKWLIIAYASMLILQQICMLVGIRYMPLLNLRGEDWQSLTKLPTLAVEPSHAARLMAVFMLAYLRCIEIDEGHGKLTVVDIFKKKHRPVTCLFLWTMLTMGSGTAFIALGILLLYFITWKSAIYMIPILAGLVVIGGAMDLEQFERVKRVGQSVVTQDASKIRETDTSASSRIIPLLNLFTKTDLSNSTTWTGEGTLSYEDAGGQWSNNNAKIPMLRQYGLITMIICLGFVYICAIKKIFSLETLFFILLFGFSLGNIAYIWGAMLIFTSTRYYQEMQENGEIEYITVENEDDSDSN